MNRKNFQQSKAYFLPFYISLYLCNSVWQVKKMCWVVCIIVLWWKSMVKWIGKGRKAWRGLGLKICWVLCIKNFPITICIYLCFCFPWINCLLDLGWLCWRRCVCIVGMLCLILNFLSLCFILNLLDLCLNFDFFFFFGFQFLIFQIKKKKLITKNFYSFKNFFFC